MTLLGFCVGLWELSHLTPDLSQAEMKITVVTSWAIDKMTIIFTQNHNFDHFEWNRCHFVHLLSLYQHLFSSQLEISHMLNGTTPENQHRNRGPKLLLEIVWSRKVVWNLSFELYKCAISYMIVRWQGAKVL